MYTVYQNLTTGETTFSHKEAVEMYRTARKSLCLLTTAAIAWNSVPCGFTKRIGAADWSCSSNLFYLDGYRLSYLKIIIDFQERV